MRLTKYGLPYGVAPTAEILNTFRPDNSRLVVLYRDSDHTSPSGRTWRRWVCVCTCGNRVTVREDHISNPCNLSCGCYTKENSTVYGAHADRVNNYKGLHYSYRSMLKRAIQRKENGERCEVSVEFKTYQGFKIWALGNGWHEGLVLCRNGDVGDYSPTNCRWDTPSNNTIESRAIVYIILTSDGKIEYTSYGMQAWCRENSEKFPCSEQSIADNLRKGTNSDTTHASFHGYSALVLTRANDKQLMHTNHNGMVSVQVLANGDIMIDSSKKGGAVHMLQPNQPLLGLLDKPELVKIVEHIKFDDDQGKTELHRYLALKIYVMHGELDWKDKPSYWSFLAAIDIEDLPKTKRQCDAMMEKLRRPDEKLQETSMLLRQPLKLDKAAAKVKRSRWRKTFLNSNIYSLNDFDKLMHYLFNSGLTAELHSVYNCSIEQITSEIDRLQDKLTVYVIPDGKAMPVNKLAEIRALLKQPIQLDKSSLKVKRSRWKTRLVDHETCSNDDLNKFMHYCAEKKLSAELHSVYNCSIEQVIEEIERLRDKLAVYVIPE